ncbi:MAG: hypothetical protein V3T30_02015, partial [Thermodesulfobacteriota bacterium]
IENANTAREIFLILKDAKKEKVIRKVAALVRKNSKKYFTKLTRVEALLVGYNGKVEVRVK